MSADEIRGLTDLSTPVMPEHWQATVMWPEQWDKIKSALLDYAAMVERCEAQVAFARRIGGMYRHSQSNVLDMLDYVLRGDAGKEKK